jgi:hypothetical protein
MAAKKAKQSRASTPDEAERQPSQAWKFFVAFGIILLLFVGYVWYGKYQERNIIEENRYNGFDFAQAEGGLWETRVYARNQPYDIPFYHHPRDLEDISVEPGVLDPVIRQAPRQIYISVDPAANPIVVVAGVEIARLTGSRYNLYNIDTKSALSRPAEAKLDVLVLNCSNATRDRVVLQFIPAQENSIQRDGSCIKLNYIEANDSVKVADRYAYMLIRVME